MQDLTSKVILSIGLLVISSSLEARPSKKDDRQPLVVFLIDGFRNDYVHRMTRDDVPAFYEVLDSGTQAEYVQPIFPSVSFPSWTTIVTGLYAESHGLVGNFIFDRNTNKTFSLYDVGLTQDGTNDTMWWEGHTPLWAQATAQGLRVTLYFMSRCDVPFVIDGQSYLPEKCEPYNNDDPLDINQLDRNFEAAIDDLKNGVDLVFVYYANVDHMGHLHGPDSNEVVDEVRLVDRAMGKFLANLEDIGFRDQINFIVTADHGMSYERDKQFTNITDIVPVEYILKSVDRGPFTHLAVTEGNIDKVLEALNDVEGMMAYARENIPDHYHFKDHEQILDVLVVSEGDRLVAPNDFAHRDMYLPKPDSAEFFPGGGHGYDDTSPVADGYEEGPYPDVRTIFYMSGPLFKRNHTINWIKLVDEYQVMTRALGIPTEANNGTWERVQDAFL